MKMTIEEKAKRYDEALGRAKGLYAKGAPDSLYLEEIFPELKESDDEKIRKALIELFSSIGKKDWRYIPTEKIIAWLEKQGEQKPTWSEEDEENFRDIIGAIHSVSYQTSEDEEVRINWLKSLKQRIGE